MRRSGLASHRRAQVTSNVRPHAPLVWHSKPSAPSRPSFPWRSWSQPLFGASCSPPSSKSASGASSSWFRRQPPTARFGAGMSWRRMRLRPPASMRRPAEPQSQLASAPPKEHAANTALRALCAEAHGAATSSSLRPQVRPNTSVNARPSGGPPGPAPGVVYHPSAGPGGPPPAPRYLER